MPDEVTIPLETAHQLHPLDADVWSCSCGRTNMSEEEALFHMTVVEMSANVKA